MKKLTAGIFAGILTIVTVNAANAEIASKAYVDSAVTFATGYADGLADNYDAAGAAADALDAAKAYADGLAGNYDASGTAQTKVDALANGQVKTNKEAIETLNGADTVENSVAWKIKQAINSAAGNYDESGAAADALVDAKAYADGLAVNYDASGTAQTKVDALANGQVATNTAAIANNKSDIEALRALTANTTAAKKNLLTTNDGGVLVKASETIQKTGDCAVEGANCMLVDYGAGLKWELVVDEYKPATNQGA